MFAVIVEAVAYVTAAEKMKELAPRAFCSYAARCKRKGSFLRRGRLICTGSRRRSRQRI
jgi:hypothetical protein